MVLSWETLTVASWVLDGPAGWGQGPAPSLPLCAQHTCARLRSTTPQGQGNGTELMAQAKGSSGSATATPPRA